MYFYELGLRTFVGMSLNHSPGLSGSFSNWEARHVCGFEVFIAIWFQCCRCDLSMTDWSLTPSGNKGAPRLNFNGKTPIKEQFITCNVAAYSLLTSSGFISWRPCKRPTWKTLLLSNVWLSKRPIFITQHKSQPIYFAASVLSLWKKTQQKYSRSLPLCHTCQLLMEILIATIKYFSKTCPQIHYHSCWSGSWVRECAINLK